MLYKELSQEMHANLEKTALNMVFRRCFLDEFLMTSITKLIDIMIVVTLNTVNNIMLGKNVISTYLNNEAFVEALKNAELKYSEKRIKDLIA